MMWLKLFCIFLWFCFGHGCRDEQNNLVDWYVLYKIPKLSHNKNPLVQNGHAYAYITSNSKVFEWKLSQISIDDPNSMAGLTLSSFYSNKSSMHIFYNDEAPPNHKNSVLGHAKGVVLSDETSGYWLIHSVPLYPTLDTYTFPSTGQNFGQSFLCLSLDLRNLNEVGKQLLFNEPNVYKSNLDSNVQSQLPNIQRVIGKRFVKMAPWYSLDKITTIEGREFVSFAKNRHFDKDLYVDWVATELKQNLNVESWLRGPGRISSDCSKRFHVTNIEEIDLNLENIVFSSENDHSKWAVSENGENPWFCVGDINRQEHQKMRGGGTVCSNQYHDVWQNYHQIINKTEACTN